MFHVYFPQHYKVPDHEAEHAKVFQDPHNPYQQLVEGKDHIIDSLTAPHSYTHSTEEQDFKQFNTEKENSQTKLRALASKHQNVMPWFNRVREPHHNAEQHDTIPKSNNKRLKHQIHFANKLKRPHQLRHAGNDIYPYIPSSIPDPLQITSSSIADLFGRDISEAAQGLGDALGTMFRVPGEEIYDSALPELDAWSSYPRQGKRLRRPRPGKLHLFREQRIKNTDKYPEIDTPVKEYQSTKNYQREYLQKEQHTKDYHPFKHDHKPYHPTEYDNIENHSKEYLQKDQQQTDFIDKEYQPKEHNTKDYFPTIHPQEEYYIEDIVQKKHQPTEFHQKEHHQKHFKHDHKQHHSTEDDQRDTHKKKYFQKENQLKKYYSTEYTEVVHLQEEQQTKDFVVTKHQQEEYYTEDHNQKEHHTTKYHQKEHSPKEYATYHPTEYQQKDYNTKYHNAKEFNKGEYDKGEYRPIGHKPTDHHQTLHQKDQNHPQEHHIKEYHKKDKISKEKQDYQLLNHDHEAYQPKKHNNENHHLAKHQQVESHPTEHYKKENHTTMKDNRPKEYQEYLLRVLEQSKYHEKDNKHIEYQPTMFSKKEYHQEPYHYLNSPNSQDEHQNDILPPPTKWNLQTTYQPPLDLLYDFEAETNTQEDSSRKYTSERGFLNTCTEPETLSNNSYYEHDVKQGYFPIETNTLCVKTNQKLEESIEVQNPNKSKLHKTKSPPIEIYIAIPEESQHPYYSPSNIQPQHLEDQEDNRPFHSHTTSNVENYHNNPPPFTEFAPNSHPVEPYGPYGLTVYDPSHQYSPYETYDSEASYDHAQPVAPYEPANLGGSYAPAHSSHTYEPSIPPPTHVLNHPETPDRPVPQVTSYEPSHPETVYKVLPPYDPGDQAAISEPNHIKFPHEASNPTIPYVSILPLAPYEPTHFVAVHRPNNQEVPPELNPPSILYDQAYELETDNPSNPSSLYDTTYQISSLEPDHRRAHLEAPFEPINPAAPYEPTHLAALYEATHPSSQLEPGLSTYEQDSQGHYSVGLDEPFLPSQKVQVKSRSPSTLHILLQNRQTAAPRY